MKPHKEILREVRQLQDKVEATISGMDLLYDRIRGTAKIVPPKTEEG